MNSPSKTIRNCHFRYRCHMEWDDLEDRGDPAVRHCVLCNKDVHFCATEAELARAITANLCVAIPAERVQGHSHDQASPLLQEGAGTRLLVGDIAMPYGK